VYVNPDILLRRTTCQGCTSYTLVLPYMHIHRTFDPQEADFFYVPVFFTCYMMPVNALIAASHACQYLRQDKRQVAGPNYRGCLIVVPRRRSQVHARCQSLVSLWLLLNLHLAPHRSLCDLQVWNAADYPQFWGPHSEWQLLRVAVPTCESSAMAMLTGSPPQPLHVMYATHQTCPPLQPAESRPPPTCCWMQRGGYR
jgi:hypothetical protein